MYNSTTMTLNK